MIVAMNSAVILFLMGMLDVSPAFAKEQMENVYVQQQPLPDDGLSFIVYFTEELTTISNLSGIVIGDGVHEGVFACINDRCLQKTYLSFTNPMIAAAEFEYRFTNRLVFDPTTGLAIVGGTGTIRVDGKKEKFEFTATIQDNADGTLSVRYLSSRPDASFSLQAAGWMKTISR